MDEKDREIQQLNEKIKQLEIEIIRLKSIEQELKISEERYERLFEGAEDGIYTLDLKGTFTSGNRKAEEICGYKREELIGKHFTSLLPNKLEIVRLLKVFKDIITSEAGTYKFETALKNKQGTLVSVEIKGAILKKRGLPIGMIGIARDITERKKAEEELKSKNRELEKFQKIAIGRELKMIELKKKIKELETKLDKSQ